MTVNRFSAIFSKGQLSFVFCFVEVKFSAWNLLEFVPRQVCISRPDLDGNTPAIGKCIQEKREIKKCLSSGAEGPQFFIERVKNIFFMGGTGLAVRVI